MKPHLLTLVILLVSLTLWSQQADITSLQNALSQATGRQKVDLLTDLSNRLKFNDPEQARAYAEEALTLSETLGYRPGLIAGGYLMGIFERDNGNYRRALRYAEQGLGAARTDRDTVRMLQGLELLSQICQVSNRPGKAAEYEQSYHRLKTQYELNKTAQQLTTLEKEIASTTAALTRTELEKKAVTAEKSAVEQEKNAALSALEKSEFQRIMKEIELTRLERETAELERASAIMEKEATLRALQLERERNLRNIAFAGAALLLLVLLAGWQRYRFLKQRKAAELEKQRVERLQEIDQLKDQFLANTSHELRTPLNGIIGIAESLHEQAPGISTKLLQENLSVMISAGKRLNTLINDIMDFSALKNAGLNLHPRPVDLYSLSRIVLRINQPLLRGKDVQIINAMTRDLPAVLADENRLQQILHNLVSNAIKFTDHGSVTLSARRQGEEVEIAVADTGIGIPADKHDLVFEAFAQADGSTVRAYAGTGLGLSITRQLIELHGGRIWLESEMGKGSTFHFTLPATDASYEAPQTEKSARLTPLFAPQATADILEAPVEKPGPAAPPRTGEHRASILIVDDEPINQHVLRNHLAADQYEVTAALNGEEALEAIESGKHFDLILLDIMMPRISGYEVCEKIREKYLPSELPVIMVTAKNQVKDMVQGLQTGANDYLAKPFSRDEFMARIKTQLNLHSIHQATGRFVPNAFLRSLGRENITEVRLGDQVERTVTVLFSDIRDYTGLSENMTPEENFRFVNSYNRRMGPIIDQHHGFVNQYLGDAIMAIFLNSPVDALQASIDMQKNLQQYNTQRRAKGRKPIRSGVGFHTGNLIMGIIGDEKRLDATTISDAVNTAARLESLNKYYGTTILLSEDSLQLIPNQENYHIRYLGKVQMKGKKVPVGVYECFNGDLPEVLKKKVNTHSLFQEGLDHYFARDFAGAEKALHHLLRQHPEDGAARLYLNKTLHYLTAGVPEGWTGVEVMESK